MPSHSKKRHHRPSSASKPEKDNPFEAKSRKKSSSKRTILAPQSSSNLFADRRIAESDPLLSQEDRYLARLQRERSRRSVHRARFSLTADDDNDKSHEKDRREHTTDPRFSMLKDDYDEVDAVDSDDDAQNAADADESEDDDLLTLKQNDDVEHRGERTHREIMQEVVQKSKMHKLMRQHDKHETDEQTQALDKNLPELLTLLFQSNNQKAPKPIDKKPAPAPLFGIPDVEDDKTVKLPDSQHKKAFHYEGVYHQLAAERRARPSDRLLTEEEQASRERNRLIELEEKRQARMQDLDGEESDAQQKGSRLSKKHKREVGGADDLDDDFHIDGDASDADDSESEHQAVDEASSSDSDSDHVNKTVERANDMAKCIDSEELVVSDVTTPEENIPYVFSKCPSDPSQLQELFKGTSLIQRNLIVERLRKCFAITINPSANGTRLLNLLECILMRLESLSNVDGPYLEKALQEIDMLLVHVHAFGPKFEEAIGNWARDKIGESFTRLGPRNQMGLSTSWTSGTVMMLRAIGRLFPASDMRHPICTPLVLLLSEALSIHRMTSLNDIALAMFVANILMEQMVESARYSGELVSFLSEILRAICRKGTLHPFFKDVENNNSNISKAVKLKLSDCSNMGNESEVPDDFCLRIIRSINDILQAINFNNRLPNMDIAFASVKDLEIPIELLQKSMSSIFASAGENRSALMLYTKSSNVVISKTLNPKFTAENGVFRKRPKTSYQEKVSGDVSHSSKRIRRAVRKEERGFARDVRKDARISAENKWRVDQIKNEEREKKTNAAMSFLEQQQATWRQAEKRQNKLAGKKW